MSERASQHRLGGGGGGGGHWRHWVLCRRRLLCARAVLPTPIIEQPGSTCKRARMHASLSQQRAACTATVPYGTREPALEARWPQSGADCHVAIPSLRLEPSIHHPPSSHDAAAPASLYAAPSGFQWLAQMLAAGSPARTLCPLCRPRASCGAYGVRWRLNAK